MRAQEGLRPACDDRRRVVTYSFLPFTPDVRRQTLASNGQPLDEQQVHSILDAFYRDGYARVPGVLTAAEIEALKAKTDTSSTKALASGMNPSGREISG